MNRHITIVVQMPENEIELAKVREALKTLEPYQTAMSMEDEMTILDMIEQHPEFADHIIDDARRDAKRLHEGLPPLANDENCHRSDQASYDSPSP